MSTVYRLTTDRLRIAFLWMVLLLLTFHCGKKTEIQDMSALAEAYVLAYTHGSLGRKEPIRIQLRQVPEATPSAGTAAEPRIFQMSPSVAGQLIWEDAQTLRFTPDDPLPSGQTFEVSLDLAVLYPTLIDGGARFTFSIFTFDQFLDLDIAGLQQAENGPADEQVLLATCYSADFMEPGRLEANFDARQDNRPLQISWSHSADGRTHRMEVSGIRRLQNASELIVQWNGQPLGLKENGRARVAVPPKDVFKVTRVSVAYNPDPYFVVHFSEAPRRDQDFAGLIILDGGALSFRFDLDGQILRLYPNAKLSGNIRLGFAEGIRSQAGRDLVDLRSWTLAVQSQKPAVRAAGEGVILPHTEGLLFPFEAIGLHAVDLQIFKIYSSNILQFFQSRNLEETYGNLREVGRVIHQGRLDLEQVPAQGTRGEWTRYAIDLHQWIDEDPGALYQVRIGFRPAYADYACPSEGFQERSTPQIANTDFMEWWYGPYGYYTDYDYNQREDPCYPAYYNSNRFLQRNLLASNIGLLVKGQETGPYFVSTSDLRTTQPLVSAAITFYDYQQQPIANVKTDSRGIALVELERAPFVAVAQHGRDRSFLRLQGGDALATSAFSVGGAEVQEGMKGFLFAERGVWRPGDSIYLHLMLEDQGQILPPDYPITLEWYDPRGQLQDRRVTTRHTGNLYPLYLHTKPEAPTGNWLAVVLAGGARFEKVLPIETIQPNRLDITLNLSEEPLIRRPGPANADLQVNWLQGAPGANLKVDVELGLQASPSDWAENPGYSFMDATRTIDGVRRQVFEGSTNSRGGTRFSFTPLADAEAPGRLDATFYSRAFEPGGTFSTNQKTVAFHPYTTYVGIRVPEGDYGYPELPLNESAAVRLRTINWTGEPAAGTELQASLYRVDWRWWWESGSSRTSRFNASNRMNPVREPITLTTDARGEAQWAVEVRQWGRYLLRVCDPAGGHCASTFVYAGSPSDGAEDLEREAAAILQISTDKTVYEPGENVQLNIPASRRGRMLITLENGSKILKHFWAQADSSRTSFSFKATADMAPNVYAHVSIIQPHAGRGNDLPLRLYGIQSIAVEDPDTRLQPVVSLPETIEPKAEFEVSVSEASGRPMAYTVAVVDEGLLALTNFASPDPHAAMYAREALGIQTWDLFDQVLGPFASSGLRMLATGGDGEAIRKPEAESANRFDPVVLTAGPFLLQAGQQGKHRFRMPNYVGRVRAMVVASTETGAYGSGDQSATVKQDLMVLATLPRVLSPGESCNLPVNVFAMAPALRSANVRVDASPDLISWPQTTSETIRFAEPGNQLTYFPFSVADKEGVARFQISGQSGNIRASQEVELQVRNPNPLQTNVLRNNLKAGESWSPAIDLPGNPESRSLTLEVSQLPPLNLAERLDYLLNYPYGCLEQTISSGFAQLFLPRLLDLGRERRDAVNQHVRAAIERLSDFQLPSGGFSYWPGQYRANAWVSNYAGHFLLEARDQGYAIPTGMVDRWLDFQQDQVRGWEPQPNLDDYASRALDQAYRLYTMSLAQYPDLAAMNRMREMRELPAAARWKLAAAYALIGRREVAQQLAEEEGSIEDYTYSGLTFGSAIRDRAMIMETYLLLDREEEAAALLEDLSDLLRAERWMSTQTTAFALMAAARFVGENPVDGQMAFTITAADREPVRATSQAPVMQVALPVDYQGSPALQLENEGSGNLFARIVARGKPLPALLPARSQNLELDVRFLTLDGEPINFGRLIQGTDFVAEARVKHPGQWPLPYENLALEQVFPSGWEILPSGDPNGADGLDRGSSYTYRDVRDDRVHTFFDLAPGEERVFRIRLNAAYLGRFYLPPSACTAMYDNSIQANTASRWVEVVRVIQ